MNSEEKIIALLERMAVALENIAEDLCSMQGNVEEIASQGDTDE